MSTQSKIKIFSFVSLDGFTARIDGDIDWLLEYLRPKVGDCGFRDFCNSVDCAVVNGVYYALLQAYDLWALDKMPHHIIDGFQQAVDAIRDKTEGDVWLLGGRELISTFLERGLIDEIILNVVPVTLGNGHSLFNRSTAEQQWMHENSESYDNGVVQMKYTVFRT